MTSFRTRPSRSSQALSPLFLGKIVSSLCTASLFLLTAASPLAAGSAAGTDNGRGFRWINPTSDAELWKEVQSAFQNELAPDLANQGKDALDVYRYKYLRRVGLIDHSAVVFVGHRPARDLTKENEWDEPYSAFNFDTSTRQRSKIEHAEWMWRLKFGSLANLGTTRVPDVTFTYLTCTECEPELVFAALQYDTEKAAWRVRSWGDGKDPWWAAADGLVVEKDVNNGGDTISFDCVYSVLDRKKTAFNDLAIRCKEVTYRDSGRAQIDDSTLIYSSSGGVFKSRRLSDPSQIAALNATMCHKSPRSILCKLPFYLTATSGQNPALEKMFPNSPKTARDLACFQRPTQGTSIDDVVRRCGEPDELGGSGIFIFLYHLDDGSLVAIGAAGTMSPILYANHIDASGKATPLIPTK